LTEGSHLLIHPDPPVFTRALDCRGLLAPKRPSEVPMTELNLETVVLQNVHVVSDIANVALSMASNEAGREDSTVVSSRKRPLSSKPAQPETDAGPRYTAITSGTAVSRAGRLADLGGGLVSRHSSLPRWFSPVRQGQGQNCFPRLARQMPGARGMRAMLRGR
jgi:hypothetical protein